MNLDRRYSTKFNSERDNPLNKRMLAREWTLAGGKRKEASMVLAISVRRSWAVALFCLGMAAPAQGYIQCSSTCAYTTTGYFCANGYEEHNIWYAQYVQGSNNNVEITDAVVCKDPSGNDVTSPTCREPVYDFSCTSGGGGGDSDDRIGAAGQGSPILISFKGNQDDDDFALCGPNDRLPLTLPPTEPPGRSAGQGGGRKSAFWRLTATPTG